MLDEIFDRQPVLPFYISREVEIKIESRDKESGMKAYFKEEGTFKKNPI
jgi:hypothetical protein